MSSAREPIPVAAEQPCEHGVRRESEDTAAIRMWAGQLSVCACCGNGDILGMDEDGRCGKCTKERSED